MDPLAELVQLYSDHSIHAIEGSGSLLLQHFQQPTPEGLLAIPGYKETFSLVSACAASVDAIATRESDPAAQVRASVRLLRRMIDDGEPAKKLDISRSLVQGRLYRSWSPAHQQLYEQKCAILEWRDFFVSYTNRDAPATNGQFRELIRSCLGQAPKGADNQMNYVARVITRHLRRYQGLSGFFDEDNLKVGENIQNQVDQYCARAFAFVQLIEPLALEREPPINWCFYEYSEFSRNPAVIGLLGNKDRHFFILAGGKLEAVQPANLPAAYRPWVDRIDGLRYVSLQNERNTTLRSKIQLIATEIVALRAQIVDAWIAA
jgi:hypothetical protein